MSMDTEADYIRQGAGGEFAEFYLNAVDGLHHLRVEYPHDETFIADDVVTELHKLRYPDMWAAYDNDTDQLAGMTRLRDVAWIDEAARKEFEKCRVHTLEQMAELTDPAMSMIKLASVRDLKRKAAGEVNDKQRLAELDAAEERAAKTKAKAA